ncbi:MAG: hypothetical protein P3X22_002305 [Thermoprotei archaeon]|nr:hypothetical protein [Thermoprotei archaeon]
MSLQYSPPASWELAVALNIASTLEVSWGAWFEWSPHIILVASQGVIVGCGLAFF